MAQIKLDPSKVKAKRKEKFSSLKMMAEASKNKKLSNTPIGERTLAEFESSGEGTGKSARTVAMLLDTDVDSLRLNATAVEGSETPTINLREKQLFGLFSRLICEDISWFLSEQAAPFGVEQYFEGREKDDSYFDIWDGMREFALPATYPSILRYALSEYETTFGSRLNDTHHGKSEFGGSIAIPLSPIWLAQEDLYLSSEGVELFDEFQKALANPGINEISLDYSSERLSQILRTKRKTQELYDQLLNSHSVSFFTCELKSAYMSDYSRKSPSSVVDSDAWIVKECKRPVICLGYSSLTKIEIIYTLRMSK